MSMISDLVDRLRIESKSMGKYGTDYMATLLARAADTIEMLSEKVRAEQTEPSCQKCKWWNSEELKCSISSVSDCDYEQTEPQTERRE